MQTISVGTVGCGFIAHIHAEALKRVAGIKVRFKAVTGTDLDLNREFAAKFGYETIYDSFEELLGDDAIDVIDICVPNMLHSQFILQAAQAGKHIICEKPMLGFFADYQPGESQADYAKRAFEFVNEEKERIRRAIAAGGVKLMYAEDWLYAPPMAKAKELIKASGGTILDIRAEESHSGSHALYTRKRASSGGGAMLVLGSHPVAAAIHLKNYEGLIKTGRKITVRSVVASMARFNGEPVGQSGEPTFVSNDWIDVENWATAILTFSDGSKAVITDSFALLGGVRNTLEIYLNNCVVKCNMTPNNSLNIYSPQQGIFDGVYLREKLETNAGWHDINADEDWMRGYPQEMQEFMECLASDKAPLSDWEIAADTVTAIYAAYVAAATGTVVNL